MLFWWICGGESVLPILLLRHLGSSPFKLENFWDLLCVPDCRRIFVDVLYVPKKCLFWLVTGLLAPICVPQGCFIQLPTTSIFISASEGLSRTAEGRAGRDAGQVDGSGEPSDSGAESWGLASCWPWVSSCPVSATLGWEPTLLICCYDFSLHFYLILIYSSWLRLIYSLLLLLSHFSRVRLCVTP